jgi:hypothetical protein
MAHAYAGEPMPFKVEKKRTRPTVSQLRLLEDKVARLEEANRRLGDKNTVLEQSNKLIDADLTLQKGIAKDLRANAAELLQSDKESKEYIDYLLNRGFFARLLNLK